MKYNNENVGATPAKMRKTYSKLAEYEGSPKNKYFYDFSLLENIPDIEEIKEKVKEKIVKDTAYAFGDYSSGCFQGEYKYYVDVDIQRYSVYNPQGKRIYKIMEVSGLRIVAYKWNIYGCVYDDALPEYVEEYGHMRKGVLSQICDIELA